MSIALRATSGVWGSRTTFVLALTTSAIGIGNLWRFPYLMGENGGALFLMVYLATLFLVAVPVLVAEVVVGSYGRANPMSALLQVSRDSGTFVAWSVIGWIMGIAALLILAYHSVVAGWGLAYVQKMDSGVFGDASAAEVGRQFIDFLAEPEPLVYWQSVFIILTFAISGLGIHRGLGVLYWFALPMLLVLLGVLIIFNLQYGDLIRTGEFLFSSVSFDFTTRSVLVAMGHAFFTLGVGVGVGIVFGAYAPDKLPIGRTVIAVAVLDSFVAIAAGLAIFPIVFAANLVPDMGPGLMFVSLPYAFGNMPEGETYGVLFFVLVSVITLGSAVALAEVPLTYLVQRMRLRRPVAALLLGSAVWLLALGCALSFNLWREVYFYQTLTLFELLDRATVELLIPTAALLTTLCVGYALKPEMLRLELDRETDHFFFLWRACLRYIAPPAIVVIMLAASIKIL